MSLVQKPYETSLDGIENTWLMKYYEAIQRGEIIAGDVRTCLPSATAEI